MTKDTRKNSEQKFHFHAKSPRWLALCLASEAAPAGANGHSSYSYNEALHHSKKPTLENVQSCKQASIEINAAIKPTIRAVVMEKKLNTAFD